MQRQGMLEHIGLLSKQVQPIDQLGATGVDVAMYTPKASFWLPYP